MGLPQILTVLKEKLIPPKLVEVYQLKHLEALGSAYVAGDIVCETDTNGEGTPWHFPNVVRVNGGCGYITKALVHTEVEDITPRFNIQLYTRYPTCELDDNAGAASPVPADMPYFVGEIEMPALRGRGDNTYSMATPNTTGGVPVAFVCGPTSRDLYAVVIVMDNVTFDAGQMLSVQLTIDQY